MKVKDFTIKKDCNKKGVLVSYKNILIHFENEHSIVIKGAKNIYQYNEGTDTERKLN